MRFLMKLLLKLLYGESMRVQLWLIIWNKVKD